MKATEARLLDFLKRSPQLTIPIYQRTYSWAPHECLQLWDDIMRAGRSEAVAAHFIGSVVYIEKGLYQVMGPAPLLVIDGQQRLTTISLLLAALAGHLDGEPVAGFSARKIRNYYLLNPEEEGEAGFKLLLTQTDKDSMLAIVEGKPLPHDASLRVRENFQLFDTKVAALSDADLESLCCGLAKLLIVDIALSRGQDDPQLIFESMNSTGLDLSQTDRIRNFVLMTQDPKLQTQLYRDHWRPMELAFGQEAYSAQFDAFVRHYLTLKTGEIPNVQAVYQAFKVYAAPRDSASHSVDALLADLHTYAEHYCAMALGQEKDKDLAAAFADLREMRVEVAYPFLLQLYNDMKQGLLSITDLVSMVRLIESYVFRRAVCGIPTNSLGKTFASMARTLRENRGLESVSAYLLLSPSYRRFPRDDEFMRELRSRDLYNFPRRTYLLRRLENHDRKEAVPVDEYTIEHIMPQTLPDSPEWITELGPDWKRVHETWLHTLGNLTLTGYNPEYSNRPFAKKRDISGGFKESPLRLNKGLGGLDVWNEAAIVGRAERLAESAVKVWALPSLPEETLEAYGKRTARPTQPITYKLDDYQFIAPGQPMHPVFEVLRKELLALDACVVEDFLKLYISYKAESYFANVVPRSGRLVLNLNMPFSELRDPEGRARDVTNVGHWGRGDVEVPLSNSADLTYVLGLVRQAFERQLRTSDADS
jgi:uncharacterized protein with ParB-like and HNH nuclease domain/predicted transport protein